MTQRLSIAMIAHNEEAVIERALKSAAWADENICVDCGSNDRTAEIAAHFNVKLFKRANSTAVYVNKQFAVDQASGDWILILDADEEISPELKAEIISTLNSPQNFSAFKMPRKNFYFGTWLRHGGKYPDTQLRLFKKGRAAFTPKPVHETLEVIGEIGRLKNALIHYPCANVEDMLRKRAFYTEALSEKYLADGKSYILILLRPFTRFLSHYILKLGFLDGAAGFRTAAMDFMVVFLSVLKFRQKKNRTRR